MTQLTPPRVDRQITYTVIGALVVGFLSLNLITPAVFDSHNEWWLVVFLGFSVAEVSLIAAWAALAAGNTLFRVPWSMLLGVLMWYALAIGMRIEDTGGLGDVATLGVSLLLGIISAQIPLWVASRAFRWRLVLDSSVEHDEGKHQFELRHLFLGMFLLSILLGMARFILPDGNLWAELRVDDEIPVLLGALILSNLFITIPCIWGSFARLVMLFPIVIGWGLYCAVLTAVEFGSLCLLLGTPANSTETLMQFYVLNVTQCVTVFGCFMVLRASGFRFIRLPDKTTLAAEASDSSPS